MFTAFKHTATFNLKSKDLARSSFGSIVTGLSRGGKFNAKDASSLVFSNLPGYTQWLAGEDTISLSKLLRFSQDFEYGISDHGEGQRKLMELDTNSLTPVKQ